MSATEKPLKKTQGLVAPQHYNLEIADYEVTEGSEGSLHTKILNDVSVHQRGSIVMDYWEGDAETTRTFDSPMNGVSIVNDGVEDMTFTVNGVTRRIYPGEVYNGVFPEPFTNIEITTQDKYRAEVLI